MIGATALGLGLLLAIASGGALENLASMHVRNAAACVVLFLAQAVFRETHLLAGNEVWVVGAWALCGCAMIVACLPNCSIRGFPIILGGLAANVIVVLLNFGMPVTGSSGVVDYAGTFYHPANHGDVLVLLGDCLPAPTGIILSLGDLLIIVGVATVIVSGSLNREYARQWR